MFISKVEKNTMFAELHDLRQTVKDLSARVFQLEGWIPVQAKEPMKKSTAYKWVKEFETPAPKKRGRPFGSKNKVKK